MKNKLITFLLAIISISTFGQTLNSSIKSKFKVSILHMRENSIDYTGNVLYNSTYSNIIHVLSKLSDSYYPEFKKLTYGDADKELQNIDKNPKLLKAYILVSYNVGDFKGSFLKYEVGLTDEEIKILNKYIEENLTSNKTNINISSKPEYDFSSVDAEYQEYLKLIEERRLKATKKVEILKRENDTLWLNEPYLKTSPENIKAVIAFCTLLGATNNKNNSISLIESLGLVSKCSSKHLSFLKKWLSDDVEYDSMMENSEFNPCKENSVVIQKIILYFYKKEDDLIVEVAIKQKSFNPTLKKFEIIDNDRTFIVNKDAIFQSYNEDSDYEIEEKSKKLNNENDIAIKTKTKEPEISDRVEVMPTFPGGTLGLMKFIASNVKYPKYAKENGLEGKVIVKFIVDIDGSIHEPNVIKDGVGGGCAEEAIRIVNLMPKWIPANNHGKAVKAYYLIPITFNL